MKKIIYCFVTLCFLLTFNATQATAATAPAAPYSADTDSAYVSGLLIRLNEIKEMDKSNLTRGEKKDLRKELRSISNDLKSSEHKHKGVYLSVGAIIIIILLLILVL